MRGKLFKDAVFLSMALVAAAAFSQNTQSAGNITGTIKESGGKVVTNGVVVLSSPDTGIEQKRVAADAAGTYALLNVQYGTYKLGASASGYRETEPRLIILNSSVRTFDLILIPSERSAGPETDAGVARQKDSKQPLAFSPAGIRGTIAPSGYSTGLSSEETAQVTHNLSDLGSGLLASLIPAASVLGCDQEPGLLRAVQGNPQDFGPNRALGLFYLSHGEVNRSIQYLQAAHGTRPEDEKNSRDLAVALLEAARDSDAVTILEPLAQTLHKGPTILKLLAMAYEGQNNAEKSKSAFQEAATLDASAENQFDCGMGLIQLGATEEARSLFSASTSVHPESARLWMGLGIAEDLLEHKASAAQALLRAVEKEPGYFSPYSFLADLSGSVSGTDAEIRKRIAELVVAHSENAAAHFYYALALWKQSGRSGATGDSAEIVTQLRAALEKDPKLARAHFILGEVEADSSDLTNAEKEFQDTVELEPADAEAHYRLAQVYRREGRTELASVEIGKFRSLHGKPQEDGISLKMILRKPSYDQLQQSSAGGNCPPTEK